MAKGTGEPLPDLLLSYLDRLDRVEKRLDALEQAKPGNHTGMSCCLPGNHTGNCVPYYGQEP